MASVTTNPRLVFLNLLRTCRSTFKGDAFMLQQSVAEIKSHFRKNAHLTDPDAIQHALKDGQEAADFIKTYIIQGVLNERGNYVVKPQTSLKEIHLRDPHDIEAPAKSPACGSSGSES